ncbi:MAG: hypothetical protein JWM09_323 [Francisellaceae bacterium]|nr:hypothetical protein [Francisellaceae bacterium]
MRNKSNNRVDSEIFSRSNSFLKANFSSLNGQTGLSSAWADPAELNLQLAAQNNRIVFLEQELKNVRHLLIEKDNQMAALTSDMDHLICQIARNDKDQVH